MTGTSLAQDIALLPPPVLVDEQADFSGGNTVADGGDMVRVPVLARDLTAGSVLTDADLTMTELPTRRVFAGVLRSNEAMVGKQLTRALKAGDTVAKIHLKTVPVVAQGSLVQLVFRRGGIELIGQGKALQDGQTGDTVRVLNPETRVTLLATVQAPGMVTIQ